MEIWKDIPDYYGYQVSNLGKVRTYNKITHTIKHGERHWKDRILKQKITKNNKGRYDCRVDLWNNGKHKTLLVARLVAFTFYGKSLNSRLTVDHIDGNPLNNNLSNLEIVSMKENINRAFKNGLHSNCIKIKTINKITNEENIFYSMSEASKFLGYNHGYISDKVNKKIYQNEKYLWELF